MWMHITMPAILTHEEILKEGRKKIILLYLFIIEVEHDLSEESALSSDDELVAEERAIIANKFKIHKSFSFAQLSEKFNINLRSSINNVTQIKPFSRTIRLPDVLWFDISH